MKTKTLLTILVLFPALAFAQYKFRPVIDSTAACSYYKDYTIESIPNPLYEYKRKLPIYYIVENMPKPEISNNEIENTLKKNIRFNENEKKLNGSMYFQCIVNCKGEAGDYQIIYSPADFENICYQTFTIFREQIVSWEPGKQRGRNVDVLIEIQVKIKEGNIEVVAPLY